MHNDTGVRHIKSGTKLINSAVLNLIVDFTDHLNGEIVILSMHFTFVSVSVLK